MSLKSHLERLKNILADEDRLLYEQLFQRVNEVEGDFSLLSPDDKLIIAEMERKYGDSIRELAVQNIEDIESENFAETNISADNYPLLKTEFANYVKDMLLREVGEEFHTLKLAVNYAFETKWIPTELQNQDVCETLYERFSSDIEEANQWRSQFNSNQQSDISNKPMAVGLAWFMYVFQLKQWTDKNQ